MLFSVLFFVPKNGRLRATVTGKRKKDAFESGNGYCEENVRSIYITVFIQIVGSYSSSRGVIICEFMVYTVKDLCGFSGGSSVSAAEL